MTARQIDLLIVFSSRDGPKLTLSTSVLHHTSWFVLIMPLSEGRNGSRHVYEEDFERPFLAQSAEFYRVSSP